MRRAWRFRPEVRLSRSLSAVRLNGDQVVERRNLLTSFVPDAAKFAPGSAGAAITGENRDALLDPVVGALLLTAYAAVAALAGLFATVRRDVV